MNDLNDDLLACYKRELALGPFPTHIPEHVFWDMVNAIQTRTDGVTYSIGLLRDLGKGSAASMRFVIELQEIIEKHECPLVYQVYDDFASLTMVRVGIHSDSNEFDHSIKLVSIDKHWTINIHGTMIQYIAQYNKLLMELAKSSLFKSGMSVTQLCKFLESIGIKKLGK